MIKARSTIAPAAAAIQNLLLFLLLRRFCPLFCSINLLSPYVSLRQPSAVFSRTFKTIHIYAQYTTHCACLKAKAGTILRSVPTFVFSLSDCHSAISINKALRPPEHRVCVMIPMLISASFPQPHWIRSYFRRSLCPSGFSFSPDPANASIVVYCGQTSPAFFGKRGIPRKRGIWTAFRFAAGYGNTLTFSMAWFKNWKYYPRMVRNNRKKDYKLQTNCILLY